MAKNEAAAEAVRSLPNPHLSTLNGDFLYHIGFSRHEIRDIFHDIKFVVMGGSGGRMKSFAEVVAKEINHPITTWKELSISRTDRFEFFKIGSVLSVSHGMGVPSITILLHEMMKLVYYAGAKDVIFIRIGTSGGIGVPAGTVVITNRAFNGLLNEEHEIVVLGERQGRLDGAVCEHTDDQKMAFLQRANASGVVNIEMECTAMAALCGKAGYGCAVVCVTLLDRLNGDQVTISPEVYKDYSMRPQALVASFIKSCLNIT